MNWILIGSVVGGVAALVILIHVTTPIDKESRGRAKRAKKRAGEIEQWRKHR